MKITNQELREIIKESLKQQKRMKLIIESVVDEPDKAAAEVESGKLSIEDYIAAIQEIEPSLDADILKKEIEKAAEEGPIKENLINTFYPEDKRLNEGGILLLASVVLAAPKIISLFGSIASWFEKKGKSILDPESLKDMDEATAGDKIKEFGDHLHHTYIEATEKLLKIELPFIGQIVSDKLAHKIAGKLLMTVTIILCIVSGVGAVKYAMKGQQAMAGAEAFLGAVKGIEIGEAGAATFSTVMSSIPFTAASDLVRSLLTSFQL